MDTGRNSSWIMGESTGAASADPLAVGRAGELPGLFEMRAAPGLPQVVFGEAAPVPADAGGEGPGRRRPPGKALCKRRRALLNRIIESLGWRRKTSILLISSSAARRATGSCLPTGSGSLSPLLEKQ